MNTGRSLAAFHQPKEHLMTKLSKILHEAEDEGRALTASELDDVMDIWKTMRYVCDYLNSPAR